MPLKLYRIDSTLVHEDCFAGTKKHDDEIFSFFNLDEGDENTIKRKNLVFVAGKGYNLENIKKTDYMDSSYAPLFSKRFVERIGEKLSEEVLFFPCKIICQEIYLDWYAAKIIKKYPIIDKDASTYRLLACGEKVIECARYRKDIEETFFIAKDTGDDTYWVVSELFKELCINNGLLMRIRNPVLECFA